MVAKKSETSNKTNGLSDVELLSKQQQQKNIFFEFVPFAALYFTLKGRKKHA